MNGTPIEHEKGSALLLIILMLLLLSLLGTFAFSTGMSEMVMAGDHRQEVIVTYLAESGIQQVLSWFDHPGDFTESGHFKNGYMGLPQDFFKRRFAGDDGVPSFFNIGMSQFQGTAESPDLILSSPEDDYLLNDPKAGLFAPLSKLGKILELKVYRPSLPGGLCTIESRAEGGSGLKKTVIVEVSTTPLSPITAPLQTGVGIGATGVPIWVHWGEIRVLGDGDLGKSLDAFPIQNSTATPTGASYRTGLNEDRWLHIRVERDIQSPTPKECDACPEPYRTSGHENIHQNQRDVDKGFSLNRWDYEETREFAKRYGHYYTTDAAGHLYQDGIIDSEHRRDPRDLFSSTGPGDHRGFVFIDTIDQKPPSADNLASLPLPIDYAEGIFYVNAHLVLSDGGAGRSLTVLTPPLTDVMTSRTTVSLGEINLRGVIYSTGTIESTARFTVYGSLLAQGGFLGPKHFEVWYNHSLSQGLFQKLPTVVPSPGSWFEKY